MPGMPDDVVEWLLAVYLLVSLSLPTQCSGVQWHNSVLAPASPISKYIQLVNPTWQAAGLWLSD